MAQLAYAPGLKSNNISQRRLGMVIDLKRCIGCNGCTIACKVENGTPPGVFWAKVLEKEEGKYPFARRIYFPILCNHCQEPPCEKACPTKATYKRPDGIVVIDYQRCIGCRACMTACPYQARYYRKEIRSYFPQGPTPYEKEVVYKNFLKGVVTKCNLCVHRIDMGLEPACVQVCMTGARIFGDLNDPRSEASRLKNSRHSFQLRLELGTEPTVYYVA